MGICSKAREVICCNQMTDIPINQDVNNNTNTESKKYIFTKNNMDESAELNLNNNKSLRERTKKLFETVKEEEKNLELNDIKRFTEIANDIILKQELNDSSKKRVRFKSSLKNVTHIHEQDETESKNDKNKTQLMKHKDLMNELYNENDETGNNDNNIINLFNIVLGK